jgi:hypothetical protein
MLLAYSFGEGLINGFLILAIGGWCIQRWLKKIDGDGVVNVITRWMN